MTTRVELQDSERRKALLKLSIGGGFAVGAFILCQIVETLFLYL